ncbi:MAG: hypothetical protein R3E98_14235 [Gemmatimonadota bacterium]
MATTPRTHPAPDRSAHRPAPPGRRAVTLRVLAELSVIFVGVFGAFVAEDVRQTREDRQRAQHIYAAILGEMHAFSSRAPLVAAEMDRIEAEWNAARAQGHAPPPPYYREPRAESPPSAIWEATLASGGVALLDPDLFNRLAVFYNRLISMSDRYRRYNEVTEREILPHVDDGPDRFYEESGRLRGLYRAHLSMLAEIREELALLITEVGPLERELEVVLGEPRAP